MKIIGISAVILTVLSFLCWLISWSYWTFASTTVNYGEPPTFFSVYFPMRKVMQGVAAASTLTEYLAILLIAIGLILVAKRLPKI